MAEKISTTRNTFQIQAAYSTAFQNTFGPYLDSLDRLFAAQSDIGLDEDGLAQLGAKAQQAVKAYLLLTQTANALAGSVLQSLAVNALVPAYQLLQLLQDLAAVMYYGNQVARGRVVSTFSKPARNGRQSRAERKLLAQARRKFEDDHSGIAQTRKLLEQYGPGLTAGVITLAVDVFDGESAPATLVSKTNDKRLLLALDLLHSSMSLIGQQLGACVEDVSGVEQPGVASLSAESKYFLRVIRPKLQKRAL